MELTESFRRTVIGTYEDGADWLERLPALIEQRAERWSLTVGPAFPDLSYNYVASAVTAAGEEVVLKLGPPNPELTSEIEALRLYDGRGAVRLLKSDPEAGALLEERLRPGDMLSALEDDLEATAIAAEVIRGLWRPLPTEHPFPPLTRWFRSLLELRAKFDGGTGPLPVRLFEEAEALFTYLNGSQGEPVLLHGDLHHFNILAAQRAPWLAIDPKGLFGEREFEIAQFLMNPWPDLLRRPEPGQIIARRIALFADSLGLDPERIRGWALAKAVLSACWGVEDGEEMTCRYDLACAELLAALRV